MLNEIQRKYLEGILTKMFLGKNRDLKQSVKEIWIEEICAKKYTNETIEQTANEFMHNDELTLSLATFFNVAQKYDIKKEHKTTDCPYCNGSGYVRALKFDDKGNYVDQQDTVLGCVCGNNRDNSLKIMDENPQNYHHTKVSDGYYLVFKNVVEREDIINASKKND